MLNDDPQSQPTSAAAPLPEADRLRPPGSKLNRYAGRAISIVLGCGALAVLIDVGKNMVPGVPHLYHAAVKRMTASTESRVKEERIERLRKEMAEHPSADAGWLLGAALQSAGEREQAKNAYESALRYQDNFARRHALGSIMVRLGYPDRAAVHWKKAIDWVADSYPIDAANMGLLLSDLYQRQGQLDDAEKYARYAIAKNPGYSYGHYVLGRVLERKGELRAAKGEFKVALNSHIVNQQYAEAYSKALDKLGEHDEAEHVRARYAVKGTLHH